MIFHQRVALAVVLTLSLGSGRWRIPGARAMALPEPQLELGSGGDGAPIVVDPSGWGGSDDTTASVSSTVTSTTKSESISATSSHSTSSVTVSTAPTSTPSNTHSTSSSISTAASKTSQPVLQTNAPAGKQPSSIRFLVPVFLLILITLIGFIYSHYRARRKPPRPPRPSALLSFPNTRGWKEVKSADMDEEDDPWFEGEEDAKEVAWDDIDLQGSTRRRGDVFSVAAKGWGWKDTFNAWRSARGRANEGDVESPDEMGQRRTIKLVQPANSGHQRGSYQTLPVLKYALDGEPLHPDRVDAFHSEVRAEQRGSIRILRDKLASLTYRSSPPQQTGRLQRARAPNKRRADPNAVERMPPSPPAWIQPRVISPTHNQVLSPPLQPHLFFHPVGSMMSLAALGRGKEATMTTMTMTERSESGSDYSDDESTVTSRVKEGRGAQGTGHGRFPTIPSTAEGLANNYTALPPRTPRTLRTPKTPRTPKSPGIPKEQKTSEEPTMPKEPKKPKTPLSSVRLGGAGTEAPDRSLISLKTPTTVKSKRTPSAPTSPPRLLSSPPKSPFSPTSPALRRSIAVKDLSRSEPKANPEIRRSRGRTMKSGPVVGEGPRAMIIATGTTTGDILPATTTTAAPALATAGRDDTPITIADKTCQPLRRSRVQRNQERAQGKVEDILKASWSDRALSSPPPPLGPAGGDQGWVSGAIAREVEQGSAEQGTVSPGVEEAARLSGAGGIEQRLAILRRMEI